MSKKYSILILAAGEGTRMRSSSIPKVMHTLCGVPLIQRVIKASMPIPQEKIGIVVGYGNEKIKEELKKQKNIELIPQKKQMGSGNAVQSAKNWLQHVSKSSSHILVVCGDTPLISSETLLSFCNFHLKQENNASILSFKTSQPFGYGRIVRDQNLRVQKIVEEKDATLEEKNIDEVNSAIYCFEIKKLLEILPHLKNNNAKKEYYLTDVIEHFYNKRLKVDAFQSGARNGLAIKETMGINTRVELSMAEEFLQEKIRNYLMEQGVTMLNPSSIYIEEKVTIGKDTLLLPQTMLLGATKIGERCKIGPSSFIENSNIGENTVVRASFIYGSTIGNKVEIGPYTHLRTGSVVQDEARIGNFTEIKNSNIGKETKVSHLAYIGDSILGEKINVGAGAITCNFDGKNKHKTTIGSQSFVGSNVNLIAPVKVGARSVLAAGSTITEDVPSDSLAIERTSLVIKKGWVKKRK